MTSETCEHCPRTREEHAAAEREGVVRHQFSADGALTAVPGASVPAKQEQTPRRLNVPSDPVLRYVLVQKGIITSDDLTEAEKTLAATGLLHTQPQKVYRDAGQS